MTYLILKVNGLVEPFTPKGKRPSLEELQGIVEGYIERVSCQGGHLWVNEEGLIHGLDFNERASQYAKCPIVGTALLCIRGRPKKKVKDAP